MTNKRVALFIFFLLFAVTPHLFGALSTKTKAPALSAAMQWLETETPVSTNPLNGKVVLIGFWSPTSTKCQFGMRVLSQWHDRYKSSAPFEILTVSVPEFQFEKDTSKTEPLIHKLKLPFPVALDLEKKLREAYEVRELPAYFLVDTNGFIRASYAGNINYESLEDSIQTLLKDSVAALPFIEKTKIPSFKNLPDLSFGYKKLFGYGGNEKLQADRVSSFTYPEQMNAFHFYLSENWISGEESLKTAPPRASLKILFDASSAFLLAGTEKRNLIPAEVRLDGFPISKEQKGRDIVIQEGKSYVFIKDYKVYKLLKIKNQSGFHTLELIFEEPGIEIFKASFE